MIGTELNDLVEANEILRNNRERANAEVLRLQQRLASLEQLVTRLQGFSDAVDDAYGHTEYQIALIALALETRSQLRLVDQR